MLLQRFLKAILISLLSVSAFGAIPTGRTTFWEVRTTGDDTNGGGFDSTSAGTDYSDQNAAQLSLTDLAATDTTTTVTSVAGGFTSAMVGNALQISSGTNATAGFYFITAYTDTNTVTVDRTPTTGGNMSVAVGKVGGALATIQKAHDTAGAGNIVYVKKGTYPEIDISTSWGILNSTFNHIWGYDTERNTRPFGANRPTIDAGGTEANAVIVSEGEFLIQNFIITGATSNGVTDTGLAANQYFFWVNVRFTANGGDGFNARKPNTFIGCEADNNTNSGIVANNYGFVGFFNYSHDNGSHGFSSNISPGAQVGNIADSNGSTGFNATSVRLVQMSNFISYNNTTGVTTGQTHSGSESGLMYMNGIVKDNTTGWYRLSEGYIPSLILNCITHGNTTQYTNTSLNHYFGSIETDPDFTDAAAGDFTISTTSPALGAGFNFEDMVSLVGEYSWNIGVDQMTREGGGGDSETSYGWVG